MKPLKQTVVATSVVFCSSIISLSIEAKTYAGCTKLANKIEIIQQKMRGGYTAAEGERLKSRLRYLKEQRNKCERHAEKVQVKQRKSSPIITKKHSKKQNLHQDYSNFQDQNQNNNTWTYSQASTERKAHWKKQQVIENKRISALNNKYSHTIKDAKTTDNDN